MKYPVMLPLGSEGAFHVANRMSLVEINLTFSGGPLGSKNISTLQLMIVKGLETLGKFPEQSFLNKLMKHIVHVNSSNKIYDKKLTNYFPIKFFWQDSRCFLKFKWLFVDQCCLRNGTLL